MNTGQLMAVHRRVGRGAFPCLAVQFFCRSRFLPSVWFPPSSGERWLKNCALTLSWSRSEPRGYSKEKEGHCSLSKVIHDSRADQRF